MGGPKIPGEEAAARQVKNHLAAVACQAQNLNDTVSAMRHIMAHYSDNGTRRPLLCSSEVAMSTPVPGEWFIPPDADLTHRCLYIHGGGWVAGSIDTHRQLIDAIAIQSCVPVFAIDYRLAPEAPFPSGIEDCAAMVDWLRNNGPHGQSEARAVTVAGDSAGGNYAAAITVDALANGRAAADALVLISPVVDFRPPAKFASGVEDPLAAGGPREPIFRYYATKGEDPGLPLISPRAAPSQILSCFPPTLIQVGAVEVLRDQGVDFSAALWDLDVPVRLSVWPHMPHVFQLFVQELASARQAIREISDFIIGI